MKSRRVFLLTLTCGVVALALIAVPVIADELFGVISKVDVEGKKLTVIEKGTDKEIEVTTTDDTDFTSPKGTRKVDLKKLASYVEKVQGKGEKGVRAKITHEKGVASHIEVSKKKEAPKPEP